MYFFLTYGNEEHSIILDQHKQDSLDYKYVPLKL